MLYTLPQWLLFIIFMFIGYGSGIIAGIFNAIYIIFNKNKWLQIGLDVGICIVFSIIYIVIINAFNYGEQRLFLALAYLLGILTERKTLGKLFANLYNKLYNLIVTKLNIVAKSKIGTMIRR